MKILVLHLHDQVFQMGGADRGVLDLSVALRNDFGYEIRIVTNPGPFAREAAARGLEVIFIPESRWAIWKTRGIIKEQVKAFQPDLFHSHHRYTTFILSLFFKGRGIPVLHTQRVQSWNRKALFHHGDFMTTVSESLRHHMVDYYGVAPERVKAIVNAVVPQKPDVALLASLKQKYGRRSGELFVLCVGRFHEQKGHGYLIEALGLLDSHERQRVKVFLAGDGPLEGLLQQKIAEKNLQENFIFAGYCQDIATWLEFCDFLILPSLWEGLPRVVLEAFSMGRPAIATEIPGTTDVLIQDQNGLLVPPRNAEALTKALRYMLNHPEALAQMQKAAAVSAKQYSFEAMVKHYHELYQKLVSESTGIR